MKSLLPIALFAAAGIGLLAGAPAILQADEVPSSSCNSPCSGGKAEGVAAKEVGSGVGDD